LLPLGRVGMSHLRTWSSAISSKSHAFLAVLGILLTAVYVAGLVIRPRQQYLRLGPDSLLVLVLYGAGIAGMVLVSQSAH
jgi:hypothetical protein